MEVDMRPPIRLLVLNVGVFARGVMGAALLSLFLAAPALAQVPPVVETPWQQISTSPVAPFPPVFQAPQGQRRPYSRRPRPPVVVVPPVLMPPPVGQAPQWQAPRPPESLGPTVPPVVQTVNLSGPRFGYTSLSDGVVQKLKEDRQIEVGSMISQFGWQFEKQFYNNGDGLTILNEWVGLLGGLEQSLAIPSLSWLVGFRTREGAEFGLGPNLTPAGVALAVAGGVTFRAGAVNIPLNVAVVPSKAGVRVSMLTGFSLRTR
jgi:hypothetical protein